jgi:hypothetical protein
MRRDLSSRELRMLSTLTHEGAFQARVASIARALDDRCDKKPYHRIVVYGARSVETQARLYAQGRTTPGPIVTRAKPEQSAHCYGAACDIALLADNGGGWLPAEHEAWTILASLVRSEYLVTGADFRGFVDRPHIELPKWRDLVRTGVLRLHRDAAPATGAKGGGDGG